MPFAIIIIMEYIIDVVVIRSIITGLGLFVCVVVVVAIIVWDTGIFICVAAHDLYLRFDAEHLALVRRGDYMS